MAISTNAGTSGTQQVNSNVETGAKVMVNGDTVFNVIGGAIRIVDILSTCITANNGTASTMQWRSTPTVGTATTFSGASASLASATAGTDVRLAPTALSTALVVTAASAGGVTLGTNVANQIVIKDGTIDLVIGVGSTTGTWKHAIAYIPLTPNSVVVANQ
jgi:hypothetical protein